MDRNGFILALLEKRFLEPAEQQNATQCAKCGRGIFKWEFESGSAVLKGGLAVCGECKGTDADV